MKRKIMICTLGILLMFILTAAVSGERIAESSRITNAQTAVDKSTTAIPTNTAVEPEFGSTIQVTETEFPVSYAPNAPDAYEIPWQSVSSAGGEMTSTGYQMLSSIGQGVIGYATSTNYEAGIGYIYGLTTGSNWDCGVWGDVNGDDLVNPVDVVYMVNHVYKNQDARTQPPNCPYEAGDVNCDAQVNPVDVVYFVNYVYKNQDAFCDPYVD